MSAEFLFVLIVCLVLAELLIGIGLDRLNLSYSKKPFPIDVKGLFNTEEEDKSRNYLRVKTNFSNLIGPINSIVFLVLIYLGFFSFWDQLIGQFGFENEIQSIIFLFSLFIISDLIHIPIQAYSTFGIEGRFGFNNTSVKTFILDKVKSYLLMLIIGGPILYVLFLLMAKLDQSFWLPFWGFATLLLIFMQFFYTSLFLPLFNKLTPVDDQDLKVRVEELSRKTNFPITNVLMMDGSKRSKKANAFFSGFGKKKKIVLYDTLMDQLENEEIEAVFAHEVGHYKKKHIYQGMVLSVLQTGLYLYLFSLLIFSPALSNVMGSEIWVPHLNLLVVGVLISPISTIISLLGNLLSRKNEYEADSYANGFGYGERLISALKKLTLKNLSNPNPHPLYVAWHYSHPTLSQRIDSIRKES